MIYWDFPVKTSLGFIETDLEKKNKLSRQEGKKKKKKTNLNAQHVVPHNGLQGKTIPGVSLVSYKSALRLLHRLTKIRRASIFAVTLRW